MPLVARSTVAAVLLAGPVAAELIWPSFGDTGDLFFAVSQVLGWVLVASVVLEGGRRVPTDAARSGRIGRRLLVVGCFLQALFGVVYGVTTAITGTPLEASFVLFMLGFVAIFVGGLMWSRSLLRGGGYRLAAWGVIGTAVLGLLAIAVGTDPFHDVFLLASYVAWVLVGHGLDEPATVSDEVSVASR